MRRSGGEGRIDTSKGGRFVYVDKKRRKPYVTMYWWKEKSKQAEKEGTNKAKYYSE